jgi:hypothetical protein
MVCGTQMLLIAPYLFFLYNICCKDTNNYELCMMNYELFSIFAQKIPNTQANPNTPTHQIKPRVYHQKPDQVHPPTGTEEVPSP